MPTFLLVEHMIATQKILFRFKLTNTIVEDPVMAKTVQIRTISRYQAAVQRSGMGFGPRYDFQNLENGDTGESLLCPGFAPPFDKNLRPICFLMDSKLQWVLVDLEKDV